MQRTKSFIAAMLSVAVTCCMIFAVSLTFAGFRAGAAEEPASDPVWEHRESEHADATALTEEYLAEHENILGDGKYYLNGAGFTPASPVTVSGNVLLCLYGGTITAAEGQRAFIVESGSLMICDCSSTESGKVTGAYAGGGAGENAVSGGVAVENGAKFVLRSGSITGNTVAGGADYGTVSVKSGASFAMYGGVIGNNTAIFGGAVYAGENASFTMYGGNIENNTALGYGGGIYGDRDSAVSVAGGTVSGNTAQGTYKGTGIEDEGRGGGLYLDSGCTFTMSGGSVGNNSSAHFGGGIYSNGILAFTGGSVSSNSAGTMGGGISIYSGSMKTGGDFMLKGNTGSSEEKDGVYISQDSYAEGNIVNDSIVLGGGFILDPVAGESRALAINGGYYGADAVREEEDTAYVFGKIVPSSYRLTEAGEPMEADSDYAALEAEDKALVAYAVYAVGETAFSLAPAENGIVYDGQAVEAGTDFTVSVSRNGAPDANAQAEIGTYYNAAASDDGYVKGEPCEGAPSGAGDYMLDVSAAELIDYANKTYYGAAQGTVSFTVSKAVLTDGTKDAEAEYSGDPVSLQFELSGFVGDENFTDTVGKTEYSFKGGADADDWSETPVTVTDVAESKTVWYRFTFANYDVNYGDGLVCGEAAIVVTPAAPAASILCGSALSSAEGLAAGWKWIDESAEITANAAAAQAYYSLAGEDGAVGYDGWQTVAEKKGWSYNAAEKRLECGLTLTVTHSAELLEHHDAVASTCETAGNIEYWQCRACNGYYKDAEGKDAAVTIAAPLAPHELTHHAAVAATCTQDGSLEYWNCGVCGRNFKDEAGAEVLESTLAPKQGHELLHHPAAEATEEADGNTEYWECSRCGGYFADAAGTEEIADKTSVVLPQITHTAEIVGLILGGAIIIVLAIELILLLTKKRREEE